MKLAQDLQSIQGRAGLNQVNLYISPAYYLQSFLPYLFGIAGVILVFSVVSSGFKMMTSKGDPKAMQLAQSKITTGVIGILIIVLSFFIVSFVLTYFNIKNIKITG